MTTRNLSRNELQALTNKFRRNTFGNFSATLVTGLIGKGLVDPDTRRLTESGLAAVESHDRRN